VDILRAMVDDPTISDVQFVFPRSKASSQHLTNGIKMNGMGGMNGMMNGLGNVHQDRMEDDIHSEEGGTMSDYSSLPKVRIISARKDILALRSEYFAKCTSLRSSFCFKPFDRS
jgi:hypothetical protein